MFLAAQSLVGVISESRSAASSVRLSWERWRPAGSLLDDDLIHFAGGTPALPGGTVRCFLPHGKAVQANCGWSKKTVKGG